MGALRNALPSVTNMEQNGNVDINPAGQYIWVDQLTHYTEHGVPFTVICFPNLSPNCLASSANRQTPRIGMEIAEYLEGVAMRHKRLKKAQSAASNNAQPAATSNVQWSVPKEQQLMQHINSNTSWGGGNQQHINSCMQINSNTILRSIAVDLRIDSCSNLRSIGQMHADQQQSEINRTAACRSTATQFCSNHVSVVLVDIVTLSLPVHSMSTQLVTTHGHKTTQLSLPVHSMSWSCQEYFDVWSHTRVHVIPSYQTMAITINHDYSNICCCSQSC